MKKIKKGFFNELRQSSARVCKCWRIQLNDDDDTVIGFTEHDQEITVEGETYSPTNAFSSSAFSQRADMSVDNLNVVALVSDLITEQALHAGRFDSARVQIFYVIWDQPNLGKMPLMGAKFGEITFNNGNFETELRSLSQALQQKTGRTYGLECDTTFGSSRCQKNKSAYTVPGEVSAIGTNTAYFFDGSRTEEDDWFQYGEMTWTSGENVGLSMDVAGYKLSNNGIIVLLEPMPYPIAAGDTYEIVAGCDKTKPTCKNKFDNLVNFQGFPDMPTEQEATQTPNAR